MPPFISLINVIPRIFGTNFSQPIKWEIHNGEIWTIAGANGSGKSLLADVICGRYGLKEGYVQYHFIDKIKQESGSEEHIWPEQFIKTVRFNSAYSMADFREMYYQQRFHSTEVEDIPSVSDILNGKNSDADSVHRVISLMNIGRLKNRRLIHLSSGELRRFIIACILLDNPRMLIFDNPFIGLDIESRQQLNEIFTRLNNNGIQLLFLIPSISDIPECTGHIITMQDCGITYKGLLTKGLSTSDIKKDTTHSNVIKFDSATRQVPPKIDWNNIPPVAGTSFNVAVEMENLDITYGDTVINKGINWKILKGEKWALSGPNGSGKSTLLSYIFADHPQSYAKKLTLFDKRRGSGESIWDIKKRIGFTSSELHLYYRENVSCINVAESGFFDSIGVYRHCSPEQSETARYIFEILSISHIKNSSFLKVSSGEQRMVLFARSLVKNPDLLILDEPFHGLDDRNKEVCLKTIESYCSQKDKTIIYVTHRREEIPNSVSRFLEL